MKTVTELAAMSCEDIAALDDECRLAIVALYEKRRVIRGMLAIKEREIGIEAKQQGKPVPPSLRPIKREKVQPKPAEVTVDAG